MPNNEILGDASWDIDATFFQGQKSDADPGAIPLGYYFEGINLINVGGVLSCRPGYRCIVKLPRGNLQGCTIFRPQTGLEQLLMAVDGLIYVTEYPFRTFRQITELKFSPSAKRIFWESTVQSVRRIDDTFASALEVIIPKSVLIMQDGGETAPGWYDGSNAGHIKGKDFETPLGGAMEWVGDRLWVAHRDRVEASDIGNPFSFREELYLGGLDAFYFSSEVTAMVKTPSIESPQLMVFTLNNASILEASHRNRDDWPTLETNQGGFQREILQIGCASADGVVSHFGQIWWYSAQGVVGFDPAQSGKILANLPIRDNEMLRSKATVADDLTGVAAVSFGQFLLFSVPAEDIRNKHTWCLNHAAFETINGATDPSWCGFWLGTNPVQWATDEVAGQKRIYHVSTDADGENRLWEAFTPDRLDNGCPIMWAFFTRGYFGATSTLQKPVTKPIKMGWADLGLVGIEEDLDLAVFYAGGMRGAFKQILGKKIKVQKGSIISGLPITESTILFSLKPQSRFERTQDASTTEDDETGSCGVESDRNENIDDNFQLLVVGHGPAGVRHIRCWAYPVPDDLQGEPKACEDETQANLVRSDGIARGENDVGEAVADLAAQPERRYFATKTAIVEQDGFQAAGVGTSESIVSQNAADRVAQIIATKAAEAELNQVLPRIFSQGIGFNEE